MEPEFAAFAELERRGWSDETCVLNYVDLFAPISDQTIDALISAVGIGAGCKVLDLCCGHGNTSEALADLGCDIVGVDFSPAMLELARKRISDALFIEGDAQALGFEDNAFDAVVSNFGVCHVPDQPKALSEIRRVLRPGGKFAMTVWSGPDVSPCFAVIAGAIQAYGSKDVALPPEPGFHRFAQEEIARELLAQAGFNGIEVNNVACEWDLDAPEDLYRIYSQGTVRMSELLALQPPDNGEAIRSAIVRNVSDRFANGDRWRVPKTAALISANA